MESNIHIYARMLRETHPLRVPVLQEIIRLLDFPSGSSGLDAGCGTGQATLMMAQALGPHSRVTGVDEIPEFLEIARELSSSATGQGKTAQVAFQHSDIHRLPFAPLTFDWAWSVDCIGYGVREAKPALAELKRVVKPGGTIAILFWSSQQLLPGYPWLEAKLNATAAGIAPFKVGMKPTSHSLRLLDQMRDAGLVTISAQAFAGSAAAPLSEEQRIALLALIKMRWAGAEAEVSPGEWAEFQRLSNPGSADFLLDQPGYYAIFTYSLFRGIVQ